MKKLTEYISHIKDLHSLNEYINEKLVINRDFKEHVYTPKTWDDLREIIKNRYDKLGPGTKQNPIDFNDIDVSNIDSFYSVNGNMGIFAGTKFEYIDVSDWNVSNVKDMSGMFFNCIKLKSASDLSNWNVSNVKEMYSMFSNCKKLTSIGDIEKWDVSNVKHMTCMFCECKQLKSVGDLSKWKVSKVKNMHYMFEGSGITNTPDWYKE